MWTMRLRHRQRMCEPLSWPAAATAGLALLLMAMGGLLVTRPAAAATYYVDPAGAGGDGRSPERPWRTLEQVNSARLAPGDSVLFRRGGTWTGSIAISTSGRPGAPITFGAYGRGTAPILTGGRNGVAGNGQSHIVIRELQIRRTTGAAIQTFKSSDWTIEDVHIDGSGSAHDGSNMEFAGIQWWNGDRLTIARTSLSNVRGDGIWIWNADGIKIIDSQVDICQGESSDNIHLHKPRNFEIRGNRLSMEGKTDSGKGNLVAESGGPGLVTGNSFIAGSFGMSATSSGLRVIDNRFERHTKFKWSADVIIGEVYDVADVVFERNQFRDSLVGIYIFNREHPRRNIIIRNNIFDNVARTALLIESSVSGAFTDNEVRSAWAVPPVLFNGSVLRGEDWIDRANLFRRLAREHSR